MIKKVLILSGSPRRGGNSDRLCDEFLRGAQDAGHEAEKLFLSDYKINYCTGCEVCNSTHSCVQQDDMADILEKMVTANVIVMATPVYFYGMYARMKTLIDRTAPRYSEISNKEIYFIVTAKDNRKEMMERTLESFRGLTEDCLTGTVERGVIYGIGTWHKGEIDNSLSMKEAYETGKNL